MENISKSDTINIYSIKGNVLAFSTMLVLSPLNLFYVFLNNSERGTKSLITPLDTAIPFMKEFIIPYIAWYGFIVFVMVYLCLKDRETYYKTLATYFLGLVTSFITFYFFQTTVPRPELTGSDFYTLLVSKIYSADQPYNCFPSIHVLTSYLMARAVSSSSIRNKTVLLFVWITSAMIIVSTLFVKQHVVLDAGSGIIYAEVLYRLVCTFGVVVWSFIKRQFLIVNVKKKLEA
jgi:hypothetical protein